jgi:hypothetical protein
MDVVFKLIVIMSVVIAAMVVTIKLFMADTRPPPLRDDSKRTIRGPVLSALRIFALIVGIGLFIGVAYSFISFK